MKRRGPRRGEVWLIDLDPIRGREQAGRRPALVISADLFNQGPAGLAVVVPLTTSARGVPLHVPIVPPEGGVKQQSFVVCEQVRSISTDRLIRRWAGVKLQTLLDVEDRLKILLDLP